MPIPFDEAAQIFMAPKRLLRPLRWDEIAHESKKNSRLSLDSRIEIGLTVPRGVFFRIIAHSGSLTRLTFQLECAMPQSRYQPALYRFELNPSSPHVNKMWGPADVAGLHIPAGIPHEHDFHDSLRQDGTLREKPDAQGRVVPNPPTDFATALAYVCSRINVINGDDVPPLSQQGRLL